MRTFASRRPDPGTVCDAAAAGIKTRSVSAKPPLRLPSGHPAQHLPEIRLFCFNNAKQPKGSTEPGLLEGQVFHFHIATRELLKLLLSMNEADEGWVGGPGRQGCRPHASSLSRGSRLEGRPWGAGSGDRDRGPRGRLKDEGDLRAAS